MRSLRGPFACTILLTLCESNTALRSTFHGKCLNLNPVSTPHRCQLTMRKQKASNKRTTRQQRGITQDYSLSESILEVTTVLRSPMEGSEWKHKKIAPVTAKREKKSKNGRSKNGRSRSKKRLEAYSSLSHYHNTFLELLTKEYQAEEMEVYGRLEASMDDPIALEAAGYALFDLFPERRGNIFTEEVYRLTKAHDATTSYTSSSTSKPLPTNHKFSPNDVIVLTLQPNGSGDFFSPESVPIHPDAVTVQARVLSTGPYYIDVCLVRGIFEAGFGPAPNNSGVGGRGDERMRLRADRFLSNVPYTRMVESLSQLTALPNKNSGDSITLDPVLRELIVSTYSNPKESIYHDLEKRLSKPPLPDSNNLASQFMGFIHANSKGMFRPLNPPQLTAVEAALTRRLTLIQGPPGTGKTTVASAIAFGFAHQCRSISPHAKVLSCAFSNVGADNLVENLLELGLKVVRVGKTSSVGQTLWNVTLDAFIARDVRAQKALEEAALATSALGRGVKLDSYRREAATNAVKASIQACQIAATKALREADVIVSTSIGAADPMLLAACGITNEEDNTPNQHKPSSRKKPTPKEQPTQKRTTAPDGGTPLILPFVVIDEACQSIESADLIPITATDTCRSLVLLGDPCQLPPTVLSDPSGVSPLSVSLMSRLASTLPSPVIVTAQKDKTEMETRFLNSKSTRNAFSLVHRPPDVGGSNLSYRKRFSGSLLLSVQYRMHPSISAFSSAVFYDSLLSTPASLAHQRRIPSSITDHLPIGDSDLGVRFVHVGGCNNERRGEEGLHNSDLKPGIAGDKSYRNEAEALQIMSLLKTILRQDTPPSSIGIVTPYSSQVSLLKSKLDSDAELPHILKQTTTALEIKSIDAYQGRERDIILFSAVRSNRNGKLGFLKDWRRMNVALTRAKSGLIVFGDSETLQSGDKHWCAFVNWCRGVGCCLAVDDSGDDLDDNV